MRSISAPDLEHWARVSFAHKLDEAEATRAWSEQFDAFLLAHRLDLCDLLVRVAKDFYASFCPGCQARIRLAEGELCEYRGEADRARGRYLEAFGLLRGLVKQEGALSPSRCAQLARCLYQLGKLAFEQGKLTRAERLYLWALRLNAGASADDSLDLYQVGLAEVYRIKGRIDSALGCLEEARAFAEAQRTAALERAASAASPDDRAALENVAELRRQRLGLILHSLGLTRVQRGQFSEAEKHLLDCLGLIESTDNQLFLATVHHQLGLVDQMLGQANAAAEHYQTAIEMAERLSDQSRQRGGPASKADAESLKLLAASRHQAGLIAMLRGDYTGAESQLRAALGIWQQAELQNKAGEAQTRHQLGMLYHAQQDYAQARAEYAAALALARECADSAGEGWTLYQLGLLEQELGNERPARENYQRSLEIARRMGDAASEARGLHQLGIMEQEQGRHAEARSFYAKALTLRQASEDRAGEAQTLYQLGALCQAIGELDEARQWYEEALGLERRLGNLPVAARTLLNLGILRQAQALPDEALSLYEEALNTLSALADVAGQQRLWLQMASAWEQKGQPAQAVECLRRLQASLPPGSPLRRPTDEYIAALLGQPGA